MEMLTQLQSVNCHFAGKCCRVESEQRAWLALIHLRRRSPWLALKKNPCGGVEVEKDSTADCRANQTYELLIHRLWLLANNLGLASVMLLFSGRATRVGACLGT